MIDTNDNNNRLLYLSTPSSSSTETSPTSPDVILSKSAFLSHGAYKKYETLAESVTIADEIDTLNDTMAYAVYDGFNSSRNLQGGKDLTPSMSMGFYNCLIQVGNNVVLCFDEF